MDDKLKKDVVAVVAQIFSEKEEADIRRKTEEALSKSATTIDELTVSLEAKNTEVEELEAKLSDSEQKTKDLETELEAAREETEGFTKKLEESESALEEIKKDRATELRLKELEESGVLSNEEAQASKIRDMSDDEFASYSEELKSLREAIVAELSKNVEEETEEEAAEEETEEAEETEETAEESEEESEEDASDDDVTPPANIDPGQAVSAALNMEIFPPKDMVAKYQEMGKAMADSMIKKND